MSESNVISRRHVLTGFLAFAASGALAKVGPHQPALSPEDLKTYEKVAGLELPEADRKAILRDANQMRQWFNDLRLHDLDYRTQAQTPQFPVAPKLVPTSESTFSSAGTAKTGGTPEEVLLLPLVEQIALLKSRAITSRQLVEASLNLLEKHSSKLLNVVTLLREDALKQADEADANYKKGNIVSHLQGLPYGIKDLFAVPGHPTTWGAEPYRHQVLEHEAEVAQKLREAGAVLVAKLSMGALAMGDVWFAGTTKNPWDLKRGSSGSSAGSAAAVAAGQVSFAIGTETLGSICSPSHECRVTGLRPTFGRVSRAGAMTLSPTMDKVGPICRHVEDCAMVFSVIHGSSELDFAAVSAPFNWPVELDLKKTKVGYVGVGKEALDSIDLVKQLRADGIKVESFLPPPVPDYMEIILMAESAAEFDAFTRSDKIKDLKNSEWPNYFRLARHIPAVEYIATQRIRADLIQKFEAQFRGYDFLLTPDIGTLTLFLTNLTGHPQVIIPNGTTSKGLSKSWSVIGHLYEDDRALAFAQFLQNKGSHHLERPKL